MVSYKEENMMALKHLFVKDYGGEDENNYSNAFFTQQDVYDSLFYVLDRVNSTPLTLHTLNTCFAFTTNVKKWVMVAM